MYLSHIIVFRLIKLIAFEMKFHVVAVTVCLHSLKCVSAGWDCVFLLFLTNHKCIIKGFFPLFLPSFLHEYAVRAQQHLISAGKRRKGR